MDLQRENAFWDVMNTLNDLDILQYVSILGSWAEYLYEDLFDDKYIGPSKQIDIIIYLNAIVALGFSLEMLTHPVVLASRFSSIRLYPDLKNKNLVLL